MDSRAESLTQRAREGTFLEDRELFGDLAGDEHFTSAYAAALERQS